MKEIICDEKNLESLKAYQLYLEFRDKKLSIEYIPKIMKKDFEVWKHKTALDTYCIVEQNRGVYCFVPYNIVLNYIDVKSMYGVVWHSLFLESEVKENEC